MRIVIGDIHGEYFKLKSLLSILTSRYNNPEFIFIGDYIDKGKNSKNVLNLLKEINQKYKCIFIRGNHEFYWECLDSNYELASSYLNRYGGLETLKAFGDNLDYNQVWQIIRNDFAFLFENLVDFYRIDNFLIAHVGVNSNILDNLDKTPTSDWLAINRYEFLTTDFSYQKEKIIFGHTSFYKPFCYQNKISIDTGACYLESQPITSFVIEENLFINNFGEILKLDNETPLFLPSIIRYKYGTKL